MKKMVLFCVVLMSAGAYAENYSTDFTRYYTHTPLLMRLAQAGAGGEPVVLSKTFTDAHRKMVRRAVACSNWSWLMLATNLAAFPVIFAADAPIPGGIMAICSIGGWTLMHSFATMSYSGLTRTLGMNPAGNIPSHKFPWFSHFGSMLFGLGGIVGGNMIFMDDSGAAIAITAVCCSISWLSGIVANFSSYVHAGKVKRLGTASLINGGMYVQSDYPERMRLDFRQGGGLRFTVPVAAVRF